MSWTDNDNPTYLSSELYDESYDAREQPLSWGEAARIYFKGHDKARATLMTAIPRLLLLLVRVFPPLASFVVVGEDIPTAGLGVWNDWLVIPLAAWTLWRIQRLRRNSMR